MIFVGSNASVKVIGASAIGLVFEIVIPNVRVSPMAAGRPNGLTSTFATVKLPLTAVCGADDVAGATGTLFVVVGAVRTLFVPTPAPTDVKEAVTVMDPPTFKGPTFSHETVPAPVFVELAVGDCVKGANMFVKYVSTRGTVSNVMLPVLVTVIVNVIGSPTTAGRP